MRQFFRRAVRVTVVLPMLAAATLVSAAPAQATVGDMLCTLPTNETVTYAPPLSNTPQTADISVSRRFETCVSLSNPAITSGTSSTKLSGIPNRSCVTLVQSGSDTITIKWNTGQTTTISENYNVSIAGGVYTITFTGVVASGLFAGDTAVRQLTGPATDILLCNVGLGTVSTVSASGTLIFA